MPTPLTPLPKNVFPFNPLPKQGWWAPYSLAADPSPALPPTSGLLNQTPLPSATLPHQLFPTNTLYSLFRQFLC